MIRLALADGATERQAVESWKHEIEHQQIEPFLLGASERLVTVGNALTPVSLEAKVETHELTDIGFVFDDQHVWSHNFFIIGSRRRHGAPVKVR